MKNIISYYLHKVTSGAPVYSDVKIPIDIKYNCIIGIAFQKIINTNTSVDNIRVGFSDNSGTLLNQAPLFPIWTIGTSCSQNNIFRKCFIPVMNNEIILNFAAETITGELFYEVILLVDFIDISKPNKNNFNFQHERILMAAGDGGAFADSLQLKLKTDQDTIIGIYMSAPVSGHIGLKYSNGDYILNRTNKMLYENTNGNNTNEDRFFPLRITKARGKLFLVDFAPQTTQGSPYYLDVVFLLAFEKNLGLGSFEDEIPIYSLSHEIPTYPLYEFASFNRPDDLSEEDIENCNRIIYAYREYCAIPKKILRRVEVLKNDFENK